MADKWTKNKPGFLLLEDGELFPGFLFGADIDISVNPTGAEICFNTSLSGYQEILTDPSYYNQIVAFTNPMLGNYGINNEDMESDRIYLSGIICREYIDEYSNWRAVKSLHTFLKEQGKPGLSGVDTRRLTLLLRDSGAKNGIIYPGAANDENIAKAKERLKLFPGLIGRNLAAEVSTKEKYSYGTKLQRLPEAKAYQYKVAVIDCGVKFNILRLLDKRGFEVMVYPHNTDFSEMERDGIQAYFVSNGPGDPDAVVNVISSLKEIIQSGKPLFGICLGNQMIALACGTKSYKMKFGHRGANQPVKDLKTGAIQISSHNHGFAIPLEKGQTAEVPYIDSHINLNDNCLEGISLKDKNVMAVQYHPEASPGPHDSVGLFDDFYRMVEKYYSSIE